MSATDIEPDVEGVLGDLASGFDQLGENQQTIAEAVVSLQATVDRQQDQIEALLGVVEELAEGDVSGEDLKDVYLAGVKEGAEKGAERGAEAAFEAGQRSASGVSKDEPEGPEENGDGPSLDGLEF